MTTLHTTSETCIYVHSHGIHVHNQHSTFKKENALNTNIWQCIQYIVYVSDASMQRISAMWLPKHHTDRLLHSYAVLWTVSFLHSIMSCMTTIINIIISYLKLQRLSDMECFAISYVKFSTCTILKELLQVCVYLRNVFLLIYHCKLSQSHPNFNCLVYVLLFISSFFLFHIHLI